MTKPQQSLAELIEELEEIELHADGDWMGMPPTQGEIEVTEQHRERLIKLVPKLLSIAKGALKLREVLEEIEHSNDCQIHLQDIPNTNYSCNCDKAIAEQALSEFDSLLENV